MGAVVDGGGNMSEENPLSAERERIDLEAERNEYLTALRYIVSHRGALNSPTVNHLCDVAQAAIDRCDSVAVPIRLLREQLRPAWWKFW